MRSPGRRTNVALLVLLTVTAVTGVLAFGLGEPGWSRPIVVLHGAAGLGIVLLVPWKSVIARRGLGRPGRQRHVIGLLLALSVLVAIGSGVLHAVGGFRPYLGVLPMQLHVGAALLALPLFALHVQLHRRRVRLRPRRTDLSRRVALRSGALVAGAAALYAVLPAAARRETGSHEVGSGDPAALPVTQWLADSVPVLAPASWRLSTPGGELDLAALAALPQRRVRAVLDCTSGWYSEQDWRGVGLDVLLAGAGPGDIAVVSATGYRRLLPRAEAAGLLVATHLGGAPLSAGHGGPARLVVPGRRGFWWVKWVARVELDDAPWWWQPPFPVQ